jgi:hypothetical protein
LKFIVHLKEADKSHRSPFFCCCRCHHYYNVFRSIILKRERVRRTCAAAATVNVIHEATFEFLSLFWGTRDAKKMSCTHKKQERESERRAKKRNFIVVIN